MKRVVVFDIDGVMVKGQTQKLLLFFLYKKKYIKINKLITYGLWFFFYRVGIINNTEKFRKKALMFFKGWTEEELTDVMVKFFLKEIKPKMYTDTIKLIKAHIRKGDIVIFLSASMKNIVERIGDFLGVKHCIATEIEKINNIYTGKIKGKAPYGKAKLSVFKDFLKYRDFKYSNLVAYADHITDLHLLEFVDIPRVVNPDKKLRKIAKARNWWRNDYK